MQFDAQQRRVPDDAVWRGGGTAVGGDVENSAMLSRKASPRRARRSDECFVERVADEVTDLAAAVRLQRHPVDGVGAVAGDVGKPGLVVEAEIIRVVDRGDELWLAVRLQRGGLTATRMNTFCAVEV